MQIRILFILFYILCLTGCAEKKAQQLTPWGEPMEGDSITSHDDFSLSDIQANGEMIMLTVSGPDTYFDYHGRNMGTQFLMCEKFAQKIGVSLRVETCKSTEELVKKLRNGEADIIACQVPKNERGTIPCGYAQDSLKTAWAVSERNKELADSINKWYSPAILAEIKRDENVMFSTQSVHRHAYAPMLNSKTGTISQFDHLFKRYAPLARWDWRLLAAQCYQESCFDPKAYSWAGACGLMQIMPSTAASLGLPMSKIYDPEENIYASVRYISKLNGMFQDIRDPRERQCFVLASYNGGFYHIRDAMALTRKNGGNPGKWSDVSEYILKLSSQQYYNDPVVKHGYMRGQETVGYVNRIQSRWEQYRGTAHGDRAAAVSAPQGDDFIGSDVPRRASKKHRFKL